MTRLLHPLDRIRLKGGNQAQLQVRQTDEVWTDLMAPQVTTTTGFNIMDYGGVGNGVIDDTVAIMAAVLAASDVGGGDVVFPAGTFVLSSTLAATEHVRLVGQGIGNFMSGAITPVTKIIWSGGASPMFTSSAPTNSWSFDGLEIDGNNVATYVVHAISMADQDWGPVVMANGTIASLFLEGQAATGNTHLNVFHHLVLKADGSANCLRVDGDGAGNVCHNRFGSIYTAKTGTGTAIYWGDSDNNVVLCTFLYHDQVTYPTILSWDFAHNSRANYVWHMQGANLTARTGTRNSLGWWDRENGQPDVTLEGTAILNYESDIYGKHCQGLVIHHDNGQLTEFDAPGTNSSNIRGILTTVFSKLDVESTVRTTSQSASAAGVGGEFYWDGSTAHVVAFNRTGGTYQPLYLDGSPLALNGGGGNAVTISGPLSINAAGVSTWDTIIGGDTDANTLVVDASADSVGVGIAAPAHKFEVNGGIRSRSATTGVGYSTGAGGTITQGTSITTTVVVNTVCGAITTVTAPSIAAGAEAEFTVTNSTVAATDIVLVSMKTQFNDGVVVPYVKSIAAGSFVLGLTNVGAAAVSAGTAVINFAVIKGVTS